MRLSPWPVVARIFLFLFISLNYNLVTAQLNVTVQDSDPLIQYNPNCPVDQQVCNGGWTHFFLEGSGNTIGYKETFAPGADFGFTLPQATFTFRGTAIYWYTVVWNDSTLASVSVDGVNPEIVDLTARYGFNFATQMTASVLAWSRTGLSPDVDHTFILQYAGPPNATIGTATVRIDYLIYTSMQTAVPTTTSVPSSSSALPSSTTSQTTSSFSELSVSSTSASASSSASSSMAPFTAPASSPPPTGMVVGLVIGGAFALGLLLFLIFWCHHRRKVRRDELRGGIDDDVVSLRRGFWRGTLPIKAPTAKRSRSSRRRPVVRPLPDPARPQQARIPIGSPLYQYHPHPPGTPTSMVPPAPILRAPPHQHQQQHQRQPPLQSILVQPPAGYFPGGMVPPMPQQPQMMYGGMPPPPPGEPMDDAAWGFGVQPSRSQDRNHTQHQRHPQSSISYSETESPDSDTDSSLRVDTIEDVRPGNQYQTGNSYPYSAPTPVILPNPTPQLTGLGMNYVPAPQMTGGGRGGGGGRYQGGPVGPPPTMMMRGPGPGQGPIRQVPTYMNEGGDLRMPMTTPMPMYRYPTLITVPEGGSDGSNGDRNRRW